MVTLCLPLAPPVLLVETAYCCPTLLLPLLLLCREPSERGAEMCMEPFTCM